jgi:hypothetical protein
MKEIPKAGPEIVTAWDLTETLKAVWTEEPKRLDMKYWVSALGNYRIMGLVSGERMPECGTVACEAGWMAILVRDRLPTGVIEDPHNISQNSQEIALWCLPASAREDFNDMFSHVDRSASDDSLEDYLKSGTPEYIVDVIQELTRLQKKHKDALQAYVIPPRIERYRTNPIFVDQDTVTEAGGEVLFVGTPYPPNPMYDEYEEDDDEDDEDDEDRHDFDDDGD